MIWSGAEPEVVPSTLAHSHGFVLNSPSSRDRICDHRVATQPYVRKKSALSLEYLLLVFATIDSVDGQAAALLKPVLQDPVSGVGRRKLTMDTSLTYDSLDRRRGSDRPGPAVGGRNSALRTAPRL
jgi:hypothetical protein